jgi:hypothetical protein
MKTRALMTFVFGVILMAPVSTVQAVIVDFTSEAWGGISGTSYTVDGVTLSIVGAGQGDTMTFNAGDTATGCGNGGASVISEIKSNTELSCIGDGIGINDDEITQGGSERAFGQSLEVSFHDGTQAKTPVKVNVSSIDLLDLFLDEKTGERARIEWIGGTYDTPASEVVSFSKGGYREVNFPVGAGNLIMAGITSFTLTGFNDHFSDFSLARIDYSVVPIPAAFWMFGTALIGFVAFSRRTKV